MDEFPNPRAGGGFTSQQNVVEPKDIAFKKPLKILGGRRDLMEPEKLADQAYIGSPGEFQTFKPILGPKLSLEHLCKRLRSGAAGANQRAVDIE